MDIFEMTIESVEVVSNILFDMFKHAFQFAFCMVAAYPPLKLQQDVIFPYESYSD
jgi:hypothetical protein